MSEPEPGQEFGGKAPSDKALAPKERAQLPQTGAELAGFALDRFSKVMLAVVRGVLDRWVLIGVTGILVTGVVVYCVLTGDSPEKFIKLVKLLIEFVGSAFWSVGGWLTAGGVTLLGGGLIVRQHRRIQEQGQQLAALRDADDPKRISSRRPNQLEEHAQMSKHKLLERYEIVPKPETDSGEEEKK